MPKSTELPVAVQNLRKIWESKKVEMEFTQVEAAKKLGWSQGAISHYLNNLTELGSGAVVKLANFLGVDPLEIDPTLTSKLPNVSAINIVAKTSDMSKKIKETVYMRDDIDSFYVQVEPDTTVVGIKARAPSADLTVYAKLCNPAQYTNNVLCAVRLKGSKELSFYAKNSLPDASTINKKWAVIAFIIK